jgi:hypothetical protein
MIGILAAVILAIAISYYSIMVSKLSKKTYSNIASDIAESTAQVINVENIKTLRTKIEPVVNSSETHPLAERVMMKKLVLT